MELEVRAGEQEMDELLYQFLWSHLQSLGLFREKHVVLANARAQAGISKSYERWLQASIDLLEYRQYLHCNGNNTYTVADPTLMESVTLWQHWDQHKKLWMQDTSLKAQVVLVETMLHALSAILTGQQPATEVLFPNGSMRLVEGIYQHNATTDYFNDVLAQLLEIYLQEWLAYDRDARIRILEIGAGTGGTTNRVLQSLQPYQTSIVEYCYSDISEVFLHYGKQRYAVEHPYLTYQIFNVEKPLAEQGIGLGSYDVVIATNVLHATSNIRRAIHNTKATLRRHGMLLLNEITGTSLFAHLTFGLLPGWWAYEDPELRVSGCPALSAENWEAILSSEGFGAIYHPTREVQNAVQQVIVAESDGIVRQTSVVPAYQWVEPEAVTTQRLVGTGASLVPTAPALFTPTRDNTDEVLREKSIAYLKGLLGKVLNLPSTKIDAAELLTNYGLDSILVLQLTNALRTDMEQISSTLFFEYGTIDALVEHFLHTQKEGLQRLVGINAPVHGQEQAPSLSQFPRRGVQMAPPVLPHMKIGQINASWHKDTKENTVGAQTGVIRTGTTQDTRREQDQFVPTAPIGREEAPSTLSRGRDIAIIGLVGRYPEAKDVQAFWHLLKAGKSGIREIPPDRWDWRRYFQAEKGAIHGTSSDQAPTMYTKWGGFLEDIECFDAAFFRILPREAEQMDPQERLFLEVSYACIEDAGYTPAGLQENGPVGVFVGVMNGNYPTGARYWSIANRVSFTLGLGGPSMAVDTACSSSLTALHSAVESLISGSCMSALVGGVNLIVDPIHYVQLSQVGMLSASDQCKSFGKDADGFVDGEAVGAILIKPLPRAEADGDHIYGVIKATAINHGGKSNGYTVPNPHAQAEVIRQALQRGAIDPRTISYIEAHGTGTELGDPIEVAALTRAFVGDVPCAVPRLAQSTIPTTQYCAIGSVKSNIGHTESASGIAGITKVLLQMLYGQLVPSLHAQVLNPHIDFSATPFVVQRELSEWKQHQVSGGCEADGGPLPRRAGISSFGAGGSNAHVILEEYMDCRGRVSWSHPGAGLDPQARPDDGHPAIIVLSARTEEQLHEQVKRLLAWMQETQCSEEDLDSLAYTLQVGREAMEYRLGLQVSSLVEIQEKLHRYLRDPQEGEDWYRGQVKRHDAIDLFATDEDGQQIIAAWMSKGKYGKLLAWWTKGGGVDWKHLYGEHRPQRISLPTYPFAHERYWISKKGNDLPLNTVQLKATEEGDSAAFAPYLNGNGEASNQQKRVVLRPLANHPPLPGVSEVPRDSIPLVETPQTPVERALHPLGNGGAPMFVSTLQAPFVTSELEEELTRSLAKALGTKPSDIDRETPFGEMGLDSINAMEWIQSLNTQYTNNLKASYIYFYPTIRRMARFIEKELSKPVFLETTDTYSVVLASNTSHVMKEGTNTIILGDQSTGAVVIDPAKDDPTYLSVIIQEGQRRGGIRHILLTHGHADHIGGAEALRAQLGVPILAFSNKSVSFADKEIADSTLFPIGYDILRAIHTPGHSFDHLCFWLEKQHILFAGDLVTSSGSAFVRPPPTGDLQDYIRSLEHMQNLNSVKIIPGHGGIVNRPQKLLAECIARYHKRKEQILAVLHDAPQGAAIQTIVQVVYKNVDATMFDYVAISVLSHLAMLEREGKVKHVENEQSEQKDYWILSS